MCRLYYMGCVQGGSRDRAGRPLGRLMVSLVFLCVLFSSVAEARNHAPRGATDTAITRVGVTVASDEVVRAGVGGSWRLTVSDAPVVIDFDALFEVPALVVTGDGDGYHFGGGLTARFRPAERLLIDGVFHPGVAVRDREGLQAIAPHLDLGIRVLVPMGAWTVGPVLQVRQPLFTQVNVDPRVLLQEREDEEREETEPEDVPPIGLGGASLVTKSDDNEEAVAGERTLGGPGSARAGLLVLREAGSSALSLAGGVEVAVPLLGEVPMLRPHRPTDVWLHLAWQYRW